MSLALLNSEEFKALLVDKGWITLNYGNEGDFFTYLEKTYFPPSTKRNEEFEAIMGSMNLSETGWTTTFWVRIKRTKQNEEYLLAGLQEFYGYRLSQRLFKKRLKGIRRDIEALLSKGVLYAE